MGKFVIDKTEAGYRFRLKAGNGETIGTSEGFHTRMECEEGIESVINSAMEADIEDQTVRHPAGKGMPKFEIFKDGDKKFYFRLVRDNGLCVLASQAYTVKASCQSGIRSVKENAPKAEVEEVF